jgi:hypothetical protein
VLRNHATVLPIEEEESEATVATSCTPGAPPPYQVLQQDAQHVWQELLYVVVLLFVSFLLNTAANKSCSFQFWTPFFLSCNPMKCNVLRYCVFYRELGRGTSLYCETRKLASGMVYVHMLIMYCTILTGFFHCKPDYCEGLIL